LLLAQVDPLCGPCGASIENRRDILTHLIEILYGRDGSSDFVRDYDLSAKPRKRRPGIANGFMPFQRNESILAVMALDLFDGPADDLDDRISLKTESLENDD
jgi:hypothetical protein